MSENTTAGINIRTSFAISLCALIFGCLVGWGIRATTTNDRYMNSLAERHEAAASFYNERTDQLIHANEPKPKGVKR